MLGSFMSSLDQDEIVTRILDSVLLKLKHTTACEKVFVLAWIEPQRIALHRAAADYPELQEVDIGSATDGANAALRTRGPH